MAKKTARKRAAQKQTRKKTARKKAAPKKRSAASEQTRKSPYTLPAEAMETSLVTGDNRHLLETYFGEEQYRELRDLASQANARSVRGGTRVLVLPGIMGSTLGFPGRWWNDTIWVDPIDIARGKLTDLAVTSPDSDQVEPLGVILYSYLRLKLRLKIAGFNADFHPFDWRLSIDRAGDLLRDRILKETQDSRARGSYVNIVAHSMGGLVARSAMTKLQADNQSSHVRRLIMLGTPNYGSFVPVRAIRAQYEFLRKIAALDLRHTHKQLAEDVFRSLPGLLQMLPFQERFGAVDLYQSTNWPNDDGPAAPRQADLDQVKAVQDSLHRGDERFTLIAGVEQETITGLRSSGDDFEFSCSNAGDGTVPLDFAKLDDIQTFYVREQHGSLPNNRTVIQAAIDLMQTGDTEVLPTSWSARSRDRRERTWEPPQKWETPPEPISEGEVTSRYMRNLIREFAAPMDPLNEVSPPVHNEVLAEELSQQPIVIGRRKQHRIDVFLGRGDVTQVGSRAVVLGLFNDVDPAGAAKAFDKHLDNAITEFTERRMFSGNAGEVFIMPASRHRVRAELIVFVGLGSFDSFSNDVLNMVAANAARTLVRTGVNDFATVMLGGSSVAGLRESLANMVRGFLSGIQDADNDHRMRSITICEIDKQRYQLLQSELLHLATTPLLDDVEVTVESYDLPEAPELPKPRGAVRVQPASEEPCYLFVRRQAATFSSREYDPTVDPFVLQSSVLTPSGKATVVTDSVDVEPAKLRELLDEISSNQFSFETLKGEDGFGARMTSMLLPDSIRSVLHTVEGYRLVVIHDATASQIPWETMTLDGEKFPAARAGVFRKYAAENLSIAKWLESRRTAQTLNMLLVVNPTLDLEGAEREGEQIKEIFGSASTVKITTVHGRDATWNRLHSEMQSGKYDVLHYAGHAYFDPKDRWRSGLICSGDRVLSGADLSGIGGLPSLAFFNACEAARTRRRNKQSTAAERADIRNSVETNVSLAEAFLRGGVANYVGTYWPVGDLAALEFSKAFYGRIVAGETLATATQAGRTAVFEMESVDWADYVLYGSPQFQLKLIE